jgi:ABC-type transport system substrate-binding protein
MIRDPGWRWKPALGLLAAVTLILSACGPAATSSPSASTGGESPTPAATGSTAPSAGATFVYADAGEPSTLDPAITNINWEFTIARNVYDHLTTYNSNDPGTLLPALALSWSNDGANTWTFELRDGVKFHNGAPFSADDVKATIDRMLTIGQGQSYLIASIQEVKVVDPLKIEIVTKQPDAFLAGNLSHIEIVSKQDIDANSSDNGQQWFSENANGTGPYKFVSWERGSQATLERNQDWWGTWPANPIDKVIVRFVGDGPTRARGLEGGEYDLANFVPLDESLRIGKASGFSIVQDDNLWAWPAIYLNTETAPTSNDDFRHALVLAYDYEAMLTYFQGTAKVARGPVPDWVPGSPEAEMAEIKRDLDQAKELLAKSGVTDTTFTCSVPTGFPEFSFAATVLQSSAQELGVTVKIEETPFAQAIQNVQTNKTQCFVLGNANISPTDITKFFDAHYVTGGFYNSSRYNSSEFNQLVKDISSTFDETARYALTKQAAQMVVDTHMIIWAARPQTVVPVPDTVTGYVMDPAEYINCRFYELSFTKQP